MTYRTSFFVDRNIDIPRDVVASNEDITTVLNNQLILLNNTDFIVANEGFLENLFVAIADTIFHIGNNFKTMFKMYRDFKRSELRYYLESNMIRTSLLLSKDFNILRFLMVPIPRGMNVGYMQACSTVDDCLKRMDMYNKALLAKNYAQEIYREVLDRDKTKLQTTIQQAMISFEDKEITKLFNEVNKIFPNRPTGEVKLGTVYTSMQDIANVNEKLLLMESHLIDVSKIYSKLEFITETMDDVLAVFKKNPEAMKAISNTQLIKLAESIRVIATLFEKYGIVINDLNRLNHNQVEVLEKIRKSSK